MKTEYKEVVIGGGEWRPCISCREWFLLLLYSMFYLAGVDTVLAVARCSPECEHVVCTVYPLLSLVRTVYRTRCQKYGDPDPRFLERQRRVLRFSRSSDYLHLPLAGSPAPHHHRRGVV